MQITVKELRKLIKQSSQGFIDVKNFNVISRIYSISDQTGKIFSLQNLETLQKSFNIRIRLYQYDSDNILFPYYAPASRVDKKTPIINLIISNEPEFAEEILNFKLITSNKIIPRIYVCTKISRCNFSTPKYSNFKRHLQLCPECSTQKIVTKQISYGESNGALSQLLKSGYLPSEAKEFRKTKFIVFDIESIEEKTGVMTKRTLEIAQHKILSIALGTNFGFKWSQYRQNSSPDAAFELIENFLHQISLLQESYSEQFPDYFYGALETLESDLKESCISRAKKSYLIRLKCYLEKYLLMDIYSFNGGRYDLNVMAPYLLPSLKRRYNKVRLLKKNTSYFSIETDLFCFKDVLHFTTPQRLSDYLAQNSIEETKSIFPYTAFSSIEDMIKSKEFPSYESFYSELLQANVEKADYEKAKNEFEFRLTLPSNDPKKMKNFADWLLFYNELDCVPLSKAVNQSFSHFFKSFGSDPSWCLSLPTFSQTCLFDAYDKKAPLSYSFSPKMSELRELFRKNLLGGLVNCFHRMTDLMDTPNIPQSAKIAPNGKRFSRIAFFDFNSLYLYCQELSFPTTPGILFSQVRKNVFRKKIMAPGNSLMALQWLLYMNQTHSELWESDGKKIEIEHQYYRGEFEIAGFFIDGHAVVNGVHLFYEFLGC